eukprot:scaffold78634_cov49-Prasinocladus_malaysianus.AAC.1
MFHYEKAIGKNVPPWPKFLQGRHNPNLSGLSGARVIPDMDAASLDPDVILKELTVVGLMNSVFDALVLLWVQMGLSPEEVRGIFPLSEVNVNHRKGDKQVANKNAKMHIEEDRRLFKTAARIFKEQVNVLRSFLPCGYTSYEDLRQSYWNSTHAVG